MSRHIPLLVLLALPVLAALIGCQPQQPFYVKNVDGDLSYYKGMATELEYPDVDADRLADVSDARRPFSLVNRDPKDMQVWELTLEEAMAIALKNNKVMKGLGGAAIESAPDYLLRNFFNPEFEPTIYGPAIVESDPRSGTEAALAAFDTQWSNSLTWQRLDTPMNVNNLSGFGNYFPDINAVDQAAFQSKMTKTAATGGQFSLSHNLSYNYYRWPNAAEFSKEYTTDWNVNLIAELRQPLLQGAGVQFNRIAGPGATPGNYNGVMIARINTDLSLANFESGVRNFVSDVEVAYWELYFEYRNLDAVIAGRDSALATWRKTYSLFSTGAKGGEAAKEAQARQQYLLFKSTAEQSLNALYAAEAKFRYLLGLAATDGRLIRPKDEPTTAKVTFDWCEILSEGLVRSIELRAQKWEVKRRELELIAAKNFLLPRVDFLAQYRWMGFGNQLDGSGVWNSEVNGAYSTNAYRGLTSGLTQEWQMGFQSNIPIGFRREMSGVRNAQTKLARATTKLQEGELELSHQLAWAIRDLEKNFVLSQTDFNRRIAAQREVMAVTAAYETDTVTIDRVLEAQRSLAEAESAYYRAVVDYNKAITQVHFRKGSLLEYNGVYLAEGPWPGKAYFDARRHARARAASIPLNYGFTRPKVISRGPIEQAAGGYQNAQDNEQDGVTEPAPGSNQTPTPAGRELVPTPDPAAGRAGQMPDEPAAPTAAAEPRVSANGAGNVGAAVALPTQGRKYDYRPVTRIAERPSVGRVVSKGGGNNEPGAYSAAAGADRPAASREGI
jgi:outer membrane protein TolC